MAEGRMNFFGLSEDKLYYDERKKRFVNTKDAPANVERSYKNSHFKDVNSYFVLILFLVTSRSFWSGKARVLDKVEVGLITN